MNLVMYMKLPISKLYHNGNYLHEVASSHPVFCCVFFFEGYAQHFVQKVVTLDDVHVATILSRPVSKFVLIVSIYMDLDARNPVFGVCEHQMRRSARASAQTDQRLCYSLFWKLATSEISVF